MPKKKIVQPQDKLPSSDQGSSAKQASFKVLLSLKNQIKEKEEVNPLIITTPGKRNTKSTYRIVRTDEKPRFPSPPQKNFLESVEKSSKTDNRSIIKPPKPRTNVSKTERTTVSPDNSKKTGQGEPTVRRGPSPASSTTHKKTKNSPPKTSTKGNKKRSDSPKESEASEDGPEVVEEVVPKRGRGRPRIHKVEDDDESAPIKKPRGRKRQTAKDSPTMMTSESEEIEAEDDEDEEDSEGDFNEEDVEDEEEDSKSEIKVAKRSAKQAELDGKDKGERKRPGRPRKNPQVVQEISEDDDDYVPVEGEEEKKSLLQTKLAKKLKEKAQVIENNLPKFPESNEDIEKAVLEAVNDFKTNYLEQQILELLAHKFENVDQTNVKSIFQNIEFNAKLKNALNEASSLIKREDTEEVKEKKRGRKKKEVITSEAMKIEDDQGTSQRTKVEEDSNSGQDVQIVKIEAPAPKKRGRPKKIVEEVNEGAGTSKIQNEEENSGPGPGSMEIEKSDSIEKKDDVMEVTKNDLNNEIISKIEEGESGEAVVKRKRGRPPKPKVDLESDAPASEGNNSFVTKQEETVTQKEHIIIQTPVKKSADDSVTEIKIEHQSGGGQNVPKKRGRPKLKPDDHAREENKEANHETKKVEVEIPAAQVIESDKKPRKNTIEKNNYDSPIKKTFEKALKEIILLSTPGAIIPEEMIEPPAKSEKVEGDKPKRGRKPKPKPEILVIDSVEKETKTISRVEEPSAEGDVEKTPKKKGRKPKPKVDEGAAVKASEEQEEKSPEKNNDEKEIKKPIEIDLTSASSTVQKSAKKEGEEKKRPGRPPKVQESNGDGSGSGGENKDKDKEKEELKKKEVVNTTTILPDFDSLKPVPKKKASEDQIALEAKQNPVTFPESETKEDPDHVHAFGGNITTTEKKRRHPGMDVTNEKFKDKLRENLVKYFENERGKAVKDNKQSAPAPAPKDNNQQAVQKKEQAPPKPVAPKNEEPKPVTDQPSLIEIEDTPEKILIEDESAYKIPKKSIAKNFNDNNDHHDSRTPPRKITMEVEEEESADKAITIKTTPRDVSLDLHHKEEVSSIQSPGEYLNMETDPFLSSGLEAELKKDWLKQDEMFADENSRSKELESKDDENAEDFEPGKVKKMKIHDDHESAMLRSMGQNLGDDFPIGDAPDGEYSISQFLN